MSCKMNSGKSEPLEYSDTGGRVSKCGDRSRVLTAQAYDIIGMNFVLLEFEQGKGNLHE